MILSAVFQDDFVGSLTFFERLVWLGLIVSCADDQGRCVDNAKLIDSAVFMHDDIERSKIELALEKFDQAGKIVRYDVKGMRLIQIVNWWKHQRGNWASPSIYPPPEGWMDRIRYHAKGRELITINWNWSGGFNSEQISKKKPLDSGLHSQLSSRLDSGLSCRDDNDNDNENENDNEEEEDNGKIAISSSPAFSQIETAQLRAKWQDHSARNAETLYQSITGQPCIPPDKRDSIIEALANILDYFEGRQERAIESGKPVFAEWCNTIGKNNRPYSPINPAWITKWLERLAERPQFDTAALEAKRMLDKYIK